MLKIACAHRYSSPKPYINFGCRCSGELPLPIGVNVGPISKVAFIFPQAGDLVGISVKMLNLARKRIFYDKLRKKKIGFGQENGHFLLGFNRRLAMCYSR